MELRAGRVKPTGILPRPSQERPVSTNSECLSLPFSLTIWIKLRQVGVDQRTRLPAVKTHGCKMGTRQTRTWVYGPEPVMLAYFDTFQAPMFAKIRRGRPTCQELHGRNLRSGLPAITTGSTAKYNGPYCSEHCDTPVAVTNTFFIPTHIDCNDYT